MLESSFTTASNKSLIVPTMPDRCSFVFFSSARISNPLSGSLPQRPFRAGSYAVQANAGVPKVP